MRSTKDFDGVENIGLFLVPVVVAACWNWALKASVSHSIYVTSVKHYRRENSGDSEGEHCYSLWLSVDPQPKSQSSSHSTGLVLIVVSCDSSPISVSVFPFAFKPVFLRWNGPSCSFKPDIAEDWLFHSSTWNQFGSVFTLSSSLCILCGLKKKRYFLPLFVWVNRQNQCTTTGNWRPRYSLGFPRCGSLQFLLVSEAFLLVVL